MQAETELTTRLDAIKAAGATDLIIDLRYNGGGRISTANHFASQVVGALQAGKVFATLNYNAAHQAANQSFKMTSASGPAFARVVILTGLRTCSASELLVNGLRGPMCSRWSPSAARAAASPMASARWRPAARSSAPSTSGRERGRPDRLRDRHRADLRGGRRLLRPLRRPGRDADRGGPLSYLQTGSCPATAAQPTSACAAPGRTRRTARHDSQLKGWRGRQTFRTCCGIAPQRSAASMRP